MWSRWVVTGAAYEEAVISLQGRSIRFFWKEIKAHPKEGIWDTPEESSWQAECWNLLHCEINKPVLKPDWTPQLRDKHLLECGPWINVQVATWETLVLRTVYQHGNLLSLLGREGSESSGGRGHPELALNSWSAPSLLLMLTPLFWVSISGLVMILFYLVGVLYGSFRKRRSLGASFSSLFTFYRYCRTHSTISHALLSVLITLGRTALVSTVFGILRWQVWNPSGEGRYCCRIDSAPRQPHELVVISVHDK